jgi:hypothetical protein
MFFLLLVSSFAVFSLDASRSLLGFVLLPSYTPCTPCVGVVLINLPFKKKINDSFLANLRLSKL